MPKSVLGAVLIIGTIGYVLLRLRRWLLATWVLVHAWRWFSGEHLDGKPRTDAGWLRAGQRALTKTGHATRWWHLPRWKRAAWRTGGTLAAVGLLAAWLAAPALTSGFVIFVVTIAIAFGTWLLVRRWLARKSRRTWLLPLHLAAHELAGVPRAAAAGSWIKPELDAGGAVRRVTLELPPGWPADAKDEGRLVAIAAAKLAIEAPEPSWRRAGQSPQLVLSRSQPPPAEVLYEHVADAVELARPDQFVCGLGKKNIVQKASLTGDSPHMAINMGSGGGKSALAGFWLMQALRRGAVAMVLDSKWHSIPWAFKDADGEYDYLPNVAYLCSPGRIHDGLCALGEELRRRNKVTQRGITAAGRMRGSAGPPIFVVAEELNFVTPQLKQYWEDFRGPGVVKKSPALTALGAVSFAGRAVDMHLVFIGQMLTAEVTGSRDSSVKANIGITAMARYQAPGWKTAVGDIPMPPSPTGLGRIQLVTAAGVHETQTPKPDGVLYRELALGGEVTPCPSWMPGAVPGTQRQLAAVPSGSGLSHETAPALGQPGARVILSEAAGTVVGCSVVALRKASQRPGFPPPVGQRGQAHEYDAAELAAWDAGRR